MKTEELYTMIQQKPVILDGATGSNLQKVGMKPGVCPEEWILENEDKLIDLQSLLWRQEPIFYMRLPFLETVLS